MKTMLSMILILTLSLSLTACDKESVPNNESPPPSMSATEPEQETIPSESSNILIAYFSVPEDVDTTGVDAIAGASVVVSEGEKLGNTQYVAQLIQQTTGGDLFRIETTQAYPGNHDPLVEQAAQEQDADARPELAAHIDNFDQYEIVLLGYPNWWGDLPQPLYTFLEEYDFEGKTIIPFITHGGSGASRTVDTISEFQPGALIRDNALILSRNDVAASADEVTDWAEGLELGSSDNFDNN